MARQNASATLVNGRWIYSLDGEYYTQEEFYSLFPINGKLTSGNNIKNFKGDDVDSTRKWIHS